MLWSSLTKTAIVFELPIEWKDGMEAAFERKKDEYPELTA